MNTKYILYVIIFILICITISKLYNNSSSSVTNTTNTTNDNNSKILEKLENNSNNTNNTTNNTSDIDIYNFNTEWCKYSKLFQPEWNKLEQLATNTNIKPHDIKCDQKQNKQICNDFDVPGFPSIVIVKNDTRYDYSGNRNAQEIINYANAL